MPKRLYCLFFLLMALCSCKKTAQVPGISNFAHAVQTPPDWDFHADLYRENNATVVRGYTLFLNAPPTDSMYLSLGMAGAVAVTMHPLQTGVYTWEHRLDSGLQVPVRVQLKHPLEGDTRHQQAYYQDETVKCGLPVAFPFFRETEPPALSGGCWVYRFSHTFRPAPPPMSMDRGAGALPKLNPTDLLAASRLSQNPRTGLYVVQQDTSTNEGFGFRIVNAHFINLNRAQKLVRPLLYISTSEEVSRIQNAADKKQALDAFWLKAAKGQVGTAKRMIRTFYQRVGYANAFFTSYKAGWKTDRGMIYIVFGEPEQRVRTAGGEQWTYIRHDEGEKITFHFDFFRQPTIFSANHYTLERKRNHKMNWYRGVAAWRKPVGW